MSTAFEDGYTKGMSEGRPGNEIDAYALSPLSDQYRVGYVLGFGESQFVGVPPDYRYRFIGEIAAKSGVGLGLFERYHALDRESWSDFKKGYVGSDEEEFFDDEEDLED